MQQHLVLLTCPKFKSNQLHIKNITLANLSQATKNQYFKAFELPIFSYIKDWLCMRKQRSSINYDFWGNPTSCHFQQVTIMCWNFRKSGHWIYLYANIVQRIKNQHHLKGTCGWSLWLYRDFPDILCAELFGKPSIKELRLNLKA